MPACMGIDFLGKLCNYIREGESSPHRTFQMIKGLFVGLTLVVALIFLNAPALAAETQQQAHMDCPNIMFEGQLRAKCPDGTYRERTAPFKVVGSHTPTPAQGLDRCSMQPGLSTQVLNCNGVHHEPLRRMDRTVYAAIEVVTPERADELRRQELWEKEAERNRSYYRSYVGSAMPYAYPGQYRNGWNGSGHPLDCYAIGNRFLDQCVQIRRLAEWERRNDSTRCIEPGSFKASIHCDRYRRGVWGKGEP